MTDAQRFGDDFGTTLVAGACLRLFTGCLFDSLPQAARARFKHELMTPASVLEALRLTRTPAPVEGERYTLDSLIGLIGAELRNLDSLLEAGKA